MEPTSSLRGENQPIETMELLPDLALLAVLSHLDSGELLRARRVCRRWRELALCAELWAQCDVSHSDPHAQFALQRAPCLRRLDLMDCRVAMPQGVRQAALSTRCAVGDLRLHVDGVPALRWAHRVLENQLALDPGRGRLRALRLVFKPLPQGSALEFQRLMALVDAAGLEVLHVQNVDISPLPDWTGGGRPRGTTRLKQLEWGSCNSADGEEPLLKSLLEVHADSVEDVKLDWRSHRSRPVIAQLVRCPRLRRLRLRGILCSELAALDASRLTHLMLNLDLTDLDSEAEAKQMVARLAPTFRSATMMEELMFLDFADWGPPVVAGLVQALASSGLSSLRRLRYLSCSWMDEPEAGQVMSAAELPPPLCLPRLRLLEFRGTPPPGLLLALSSSVAPDLQRLIVNDPRSYEEVSALPWVRDLRAAHPRLQVVQRGTALRARAPHE